MYKLLKKFEQYPTFMLGVESIRTVQKSKADIIADWEINVNGTLIKWRQQSQCDDKNHKICFKALAGDFDRYEGMWEVLGDGKGSIIKLAVTLEWGKHIFLPYTELFIARKTEAVLRSMLRSIRRRLIKGSSVEKRNAIISEPIIYRNKYKQKIVGYFDHMKGTALKNPFIIMPPGYGETKRDALSTAYYLAKNGFNVIRYDATDHVGESEGDMVNATMRKMKEDILATIDYVKKTFGPKHIGMVASSLAKRVAIKAAKENQKIHFLLGIVGVVDLQHTLAAVYREDMIGTTLAGKRWPVTDVLGFEVSGNFLETAISDNFHNLTTTLDDVKNLRIPIVFLVAENDVWVKLEDVKLVIEKVKTQKKELHVIAGALHQVFENPKAARTAQKQVVCSSANYLLRKKMKHEDVVEPNLREIALQNRIEKERARLSEIVTIKQEKEFWSEYLTSFTIINKSPDYRSYLNLLTELLEKPKDGSYILDAGCGVGYFGAWLLNTVFTELEHKNLTAFPNTHSHSRYYGVDFVDAALKAAQKDHEDMKIRFLTKRKAPHKIKSFFPCFYENYDLNNDLPFEDSYFDKICCSLLISYLDNPMVTMQELMRVLKRGGTIVVSSLKPFADLSQIYRNFVSAANTETEIIEARKLLSNAGKIKQKGNAGHYHFYTEKELKMLLVIAGGEKVKIFRSLGNQVNVAVASKKR
ncbi:MAG: methyltransferase domain-containing protein [Candidatus Omnitrophica bacterium]|nr:methyltransferase domain-containing protein [Candidatus Omnitrophota bacterium]